MELKLRVNPLPAHLWGKNLRTFMTKARWAQFRAEIIDRRGLRCEVCGCDEDDPLHAHEEWSLDFTVKPPIAKLSGIGLICWHCHMCEHFGRLNTLIANGALKPEAREEVIEHFCEVNGVGRDAFTAHYTEAIAEWERRSRMHWLVDWGDFRHLLPKTSLREHYDKDGNPVAWLSFDHIDSNRLSAFLYDLSELSRFYGVWIGQTNKRKLVPLHMRDPGDHVGEYRAETKVPWGEIPVSDPRADNYGAYMGWTDDPISPLPPTTVQGATATMPARAGNGGSTDSTNSG